MDSSSDHEDAKPSPTLPDRDDDDDVTDDLDLEERDIIRQMVKLDVHKFDKIVKVAKRALLERATLEGVDERAEVVNLTDDDEDSASSGSSFDVDVIRQPGDFCPIHDTEQFSFSAPTLMGDDSEKRVRSRRVFTEVIDLSDEDSDDDDDEVEVIDNDNDHDGNEKEEEENNCVIIEEEIISKKTTARKKNKEKKIREKNHRSTETLGEANQKKVAESELFGDVPIDNLVDAYKNCGKMPEMDKRTDTKEVTVIKKNRKKYQSDLEEYISNSKDIIASQKTVTSKKSRNKPERLSKKKKKVPQEVVLSDDDDDEVQVIYKNATKQRELPSKKKNDVELLLSSEDEDIYKPSTSTYQPKKKNKKPKNLVIHEGSDNDSLDGSLSINEERILSSIAKCKPTTEPPKEVLTTTITLATGSDDDGFGDDGSLTNDDAPPPPPIVQPSVIGLAGDDDATEEEELDVVMKNNRDNGEGASLPPVIDDSNEKKEEEKDNNDNPSVQQPISDSIEVELNQEDESQPPLIIDTEKVEKEEGMVSDDRNNDSPPLMMPDSVEVNKGNNNDPQQLSTEESPLVVPQVTGEMMMKVKIEREEELDNIKIEVIVKKEVEPIREGETIDVSDDDDVVDVVMNKKEKAQKILDNWKPLPFTEYEIKHELEYGDVDAFFEEIGLSTGDETKKKKPKKRQSQQQQKQQQQPEMGQLFPITSKPKTQKGKSQREKEDPPPLRPSTSGSGPSTSSSSKRKKSRDVKEPTTRRDKRQKK